MSKQSKKYNKFDPSMDVAKADRAKASKLKIGTAVWLIDQGRTALTAYDAVKEIRNGADRDELENAQINAAREIAKLITVGALSTVLDKSFGKILTGLKNTPGLDIVVKKVDMALSKIGGNSALSPIIDYSISELIEFGADELIDRLLENESVIEFMDDLYDDIKPIFYDEDLGLMEKALLSYGGLLDHIKNALIDTSISFRDSITMKFLDLLMDDYDRADRIQRYQYADPLILDLNGNGKIDVSGTDGGVRFDYDGNGIANLTGWITGGDGLLVYDRNGDGIINDGSELFGDDFILGEKPKDGFNLIPG